MTTASPRVRRSQPKSSAERSFLRKWASSAPALLAMLGIGVFGVCVIIQQPARTAARYREAADEALVAGDFKTARLCFERLLQTSQSDPSLWYGLARSLDGLQQTSESNAILLRIAPTDSPGYAPAQVWLAEQLLATHHDPQATRLAEQHLRRAIESDPASSEAQALLATLATRNNEKLMRDR